MPWEVALGAVFVSGVLFLVLSLVGVREMIFNAISPSMKNAIAAGIGLFIAFIGLQNAGLIVKDPGTAVKLNAHFASPDLVVFFVGLLVGGRAARAPGARLDPVGHPGGRRAGGRAQAGAAACWRPAVAASPLVAESGLDAALRDRQPASSPRRRRCAPTFLQMDVRDALTLAMLPFIAIFLFMVVFDTVGTLVGVAQQAGLHARQQAAARATGDSSPTRSARSAGACLGTSTVTSYIESATGVEQGGRTGLTALTVAALFLLALFFSPVVAMLGSYPPITAPALVLVGGDDAAQRAARWTGTTTPSRCRRSWCCSASR